MRNLFLFILPALVLSGLGTFTSAPAAAVIEQHHQPTKTKPMGVSIVLYRVAEAARIDELSNLEKQLDKSKSVNLYKITQDLGIIFMNTADPYRDVQALPFRMLYGTYVEKQAGDRVINGFVSTTEVAAICDWIRKNKVDSFEGFAALYDRLSGEAKQALEDIGADSKEGLFKGYVQPLTRFYFAALKDKNAVVICGE
jgi:hypothetical protein